MVEERRVVADLKGRGGDEGNYVGKEFGKSMLFCVGWGKC